MNELELPLALRIERLSRFVERLGATISDDVKVYVEIYWVNIQDSSLGGQDSILKSWPEAEVAVMILNETEISVVRKVLTNETGVVLVNVCALNGRLPTRF